LTRLPCFQPEFPWSRASFFLATIFMMPQRMGH
jgi:hypothetical protein